MSDPDIHEEDALRLLVTSEGWELLQGHLARDWGAEAYARQIDHLIAQAKISGHSVESDLCELGAAARAVRLFAQWPERRLAELSAAKDTAARLRNPFVRQRRA